MGDGAGAGCDPADLSLRVSLVNEAGASPASIEHAKIETEAIWSAAGLRIVWIEHTRGVPIDGQLYVLIRPAFGGSPPRDAEATRSRRLVMGRVLFSETGGTPTFIEVSLTATRTSILTGRHHNRRVGELPEFARQQMIGRALGRIIAHELGHWLFGRGHTREGLMKPTLYPDDLAAPHLPTLPIVWNPTSLHRLRASSEIWSCQ